MTILALTHRLPYAPNRGDRIRSYHILRRLAQTASVHLFSLADPEDLKEVSQLQSWLASVTAATPPRPLNMLRGVGSLAGHTPLTHTLLSVRHGGRDLAALAARVRPDVVFAYCTGIAPYAVDGPLAHLPCVLDMVDVDSLKWASLSRTSAFPMRWIYAREARVLQAFEARAARHARTTLVVNAREREALATFAPDAPIAVVENGIDTSFFAPTDPPRESHAIVFCGVMDYPPNVEAVEWFAERVFPAIRGAIPAATFSIVGARPTAGVRRLADTSGITVTGAVDDVRPYLWQAAVSVAPLVTARGLQNKVLEALAAGLPVVTTPAVAEGLPGAALPGCRVAQDAEAFARAVLELLRRTPAERRALSSQADLSSITWESRLRELPAIFEAAAR